MKKEVRIALYIVSIVCVILLGAAMIYAAHHGGSIRQKDSRQTDATAGTEAAEDSKDKNGESDLKTSDKTDGKNDSRQVEKNCLLSVFPLFIIKRLTTNHQSSHNNTIPDQPQCPYYMLSFF